MEINLLQELANRYTYTEDGRLINKATGRFGDTYQNNWGYRRVTWDRGAAGRVRERVCTPACLVHASRGYTPRVDGGPH